MSGAADGRVAVVIPAWRAERWIAGALDTVAAQEHPATEVLVVPDGDTGPLLAAVESWRIQHGGVPVRVVASEVNRGVSTARNLGVAATPAEWVAFLDADDRWTPQHLQAAMRAAAAGAEVIVAGIHTTGEDGHPLAGAPACMDLPTDRRALASALFTCRSILTTSAVTVNRAAFEAAGGFDPELTHGEDADLWLRLAGAGRRFAATGEVSCLYRKHSASAMAQTHRVLEGTARFQAKHLANADLPRGLARRRLRRTLWATFRIHRRSQPALALRALARWLRGW